MEENISRYPIFFFIQIVNVLHSQAILVEFVGIQYYTNYLVFRI